jgi:hypothetical protein
LPRGPFGFGRVDFGVGTVGVGSVSGDGTGDETATSAYPTRICVPAGSPPWSAVRWMSSAVTLPRKLVALGEEPCARTIAKPQSPRPTRWPGPAPTGCPPTVSVATPDCPKSPVAPSTVALASTLPRIDEAVTSPPNSESELTSAVAFAVAVCPGLALVLATDEPHETTSALGYADAAPNDTWLPETPDVAAPRWPGTITLIA